MDRCHSPDEVSLHARYAHTEHNSKVHLKGAYTVLVCEDSQIGSLTMGSEKGWAGVNVWHNPRGLDARGS